MKSNHKENKNNVDRFLCLWCHCRMRGNPRRDWMCRFCSGVKAMTEKFRRQGDGY